ncbi:Rrf2 family transcriptional regulator [Clostridium sp. MCC353]|uniref:RrF2 family transcriptional regulator n=1 Tax=Clostridium sp. MCC353 TaxID=2592646 RepID=UPI001C00EBA0|nr:Rrf2 family transcriptional regulator [Clostridium sp. MCC353]MBT9775501.1 Rrf2 family transcriptional regulator [Clostridium sp. MCC353]
MLFTRECDYAVRIVRALSHGGIVSVQEISAKEDITVSIAYKITRKLEKSGLLKSHRGSSGGYSLTRPVTQLTLYDVFTVIDPDLLITECMGSSYSCSRNTGTHPCRVHGEFSRLQNLLVRELKAKTLSDLISNE